MYTLQLARKLALTEVFDQQFLTKHTGRTVHIKGFCPDAKSLDPTVREFPLCKHCAQKYIKCDSSQF